MEPGRIQIEIKYIAAGSAVCGIVVYCSYQFSVNVDIAGAVAAIGLSENFNSRTIEIEFVMGLIACASPGIAVIGAPCQWVASFVITDLAAVMGINALFDSSAVRASDQLPLLFLQQA